MEFNNALKDFEQNVLPGLSLGNNDSNKSQPTNKNTISVRVNIDANEEELTPPINNTPNDATVVEESSEEGTALVINEPVVEVAPKQINKILFMMAYID